VKGTFKTAWLSLLVSAIVLVSSAAVSVQAPDYILGRTVTDREIRAGNISVAIAAYLRTLASGVEGYQR